MPIGERIYAARMAKRWSLRDLASRTGVSHTAIAKYERGADVPGADVLLRLSRALGMPLETLKREPLNELVISLIHRPAGLSARVEASIRAGILDWLGGYLEIEALLGEVPALALPKYNVAQLLEEQGIKVGFYAGDADFDVCTYLANDAPLIVVNADLPGDRERFYLASETGHLVMQMGASIEPGAALERFARAFLVPQSSARNALGSQRNEIGTEELGWLCSEYGLSGQAWIERARDVEVIDEEAASKLSRLLRRRGIPDKVFEPERSHRMERLVHRALAEGIIPPSKANELLLLFRA
jgi:transcriptional regulator with XRE-family HTH domain